MSAPIILKVDYEERNEVKKLGAKFNPKIKRWVAPAGAKAENFAKWAPQLCSEATVEIASPIYLVQSHEPCWKCDHVTPVYSLACGKLKDSDWNRMMSDFFVLDYINNLDEKLTSVFKDIESYFPDYSKQTDSWYYANHCAECFAMFGDHFMHREPGGAFTPSSEYECDGITLITLDFNQNFSLDCGFHSDCDGGIIRRFAKKMSFKEWNDSAKQK